MATKPTSKQASKQTDTATVAVTPRVWVSFPNATMLMNIVARENGARWDEAAADFTIRHTLTLAKAYGTRRFAVKMGEVSKPLYDGEGKPTGKKGLSAIGVGMARLKEMGMDIVFHEYPKDQGNNALAFAKAVGATVYAGLVADGVTIRMPDGKDKAFDTLQQAKVANTLLQVDGRPVKCRLHYLAKDGAKATDLTEQDALAWLERARADTAAWFATQADKQEAALSALVGGASGSTKREKEADRKDYEAAGMDL